MSGFLVLKPGVGSSSRTAKSVKRWFSLLPDFVLYAFRTELDERAMTATPLPGYTVLTGAQLKADPSVAERDRDKIIKMFVQQSSNGVNCDSNVSQLFQKVYYFAGNSVEEVERLEQRERACVEFVFVSEFCKISDLRSKDQKSILLLAIFVINLKGI